MNPPTSRKWLRQFIGVLNYYHDILARLSHMLAPLTNTTSRRVKFKWTKINQDGFYQIKWVE